MSLLKDVLTSHDASVIPLDARQADYSRVRFLVSSLQFLCKGVCLYTQGSILPFDKLLDSNVCNYNLSL